MSTTTTTTTCKVRTCDECKPVENCETPGYIDEGCITEESTDCSSFAGDDNEEVGVEHGDILTDLIETIISYASLIDETILNKISIEDSDYISTTSETDIDGNVTFTSELDVDLICEHCSEITTTSTSTTSTSTSTTSTSTTTTTTTQIPTTTTTTTNPLLDCTEYLVKNDSGSSKTVSWLDCGGESFPVHSLEDQEFIVVCAVTGTLSAPDCIVIETGECDIELSTTTSTTTADPDVSTTTTTSTEPPTTTTTTTEEPLTMYWGWKDDQDLLDETTIEASPNFQNILPPEDYICSFAGGDETPQYLWFAEPLICDAKTKWQDTIQIINNGSIGTDQDLFGATQTSGGYRFYITEYQTQQSNPIQFRVS